MYPLSALLFILSVEIMALKLRSNKYIKGITIKIDEKNHSIKMFYEFKRRNYICSKWNGDFGSLSGLMLNRNKTQRCELEN